MAHRNLRVDDLGGEYRMLVIRVARIEEFNEVRAFYDLVIDQMQDAEFKPGWEKGIYPTEEFLRDAINNQELYVGTLNGKCVSAMVINQENVEGYEKAKWNIVATNEEVSIIHALGILPTYQGQGIAKQMVKEAINIAESNCKKAIRLDVLGTNIPAQKLYAKMGFQYIDTIKLYYEDTGLTDYLLYEYKI